MSFTIPLNLDSFLRAWIRKPASAWKLLCKKAQSPRQGVIRTRSWRIIDLLLNGHSVVHAEIQEYANVLASNNCAINALIAFMHKRTKI